MRMNHIAIKRFAGLSEMEIPFREGINVLLGRNEAGKSTVVHAISAALFLPTEAKGKGASALKRMIEQYKPLAGGDVFGVSLSFSQRADTFRLTKQWGKKPLSELAQQDGGIYADDGEIMRRLQDILRFSPVTYESLVFAKQAAFKETVTNIRLHASDDIADFLSQAVMDLGGVSIQELTANLQAEYKRLTGNWDLVLGTPNKGKGLDKKYEKGNGSIILCYYTSEQAARELNEAKETERQRDVYRAQIEALRHEKSEIEKELAAFSDISDHMMLRHSKEEQLNKIYMEIDRLTGIAEDWIILDERIERANAEIQRCRKKIDEYTKQLELIDRYETALLAQTNLEKVRTVQQQIVSEQEKLNGMQNISEEELAELNRLEHDMLCIQSQTDGAGIKAQIIKKKDVSIAVTADFDGEAVLDGQMVTAKNCLRIKVGDVAEVKVQLGDLDYEGIKTEYTVARAVYKALCSRLGASDRTEAEQKKRVYEQTAALIEQKKARMEEILDGRTIAELKKEAAGSKPLYSRQETEAGRDLCRMELAKAELKREQDIKKRSVYKTEFSVYNKILAAIQEEKSKAEPLRREIDTLATCPKQFADVDAFITYVNEQRKRDTVISEKIAGCTAEYASLAYDGSLEELEETIRIHTACMEQDITKACAIEKILAAIEETKQDIQSMTYASLENRFNQYLSLLTGGRYTVSHFAEAFGFTLSNDTVCVGMEQLSAGTADCVALAFRFSLLDEVMQEDSICILDDCLVDLDSVRREAAAGLIRQFAQKHQVIFATCSRETADLLGGNIIDMEAYYNK